jgi:hypothetical protein
MKPIALLVSLSLLAAPLASPAEAFGKPGGCLKYGVGGAVAGHYAHHHAWKGFIAGCAVGWAVRHKYNEQQKLLRQQKLQQQKASSAPPPATQTSAPPATTTH